MCLCTHTADYGSYAHIIIERSGCQALANLLDWTVAARVTVSTATVQRVRAGLPTISSSSLILSAILAWPQYSHCLKAASCAGFLEYF